MLKMESYEKIRKMGEISKQLRAHGLATDNIDAQKEAEKIMGKNNEFYVSQDEINKVQYRKIEENKKEETEKSNINPTIIDNLTNKVSSIESMMNIMRDKMNEIISKMNELEGKINVQPRQEVQATLSSAAKSSESPRINQSQYQQTTQNSNNNSGNNRASNEVKKEYSPEDVAVDKIFYAGKK